MYLYYLEVGAMCQSSIMVSAMCTCSFVTALTLYYYTCRPFALSISQNAPSLNGILSSLSPQANDTAEQRHSDDSEEAAAMSNETDYAYDDDFAGNATLTSSAVAASDPHCPGVASSSLNASSAETLPCWQVRN